jgi:outer membrane autotransporter protein
VFQTGNDLNLIAVDGTGVAATNFAALQTGLDYLGTVNGAQLDQQSDCLDNTCDFNTGKRLWARGFGRFGEEDAQDGNAGYDYRNAGTALGGDLELGSGFTLGGSLGYAATKSEVDHNAAEANIDGEFAAIYATYETGDFFVTGIASGGVQQFDLERQVASAGGTDTARADTDGFLVGGSLQAGFRLDFPGAWRLTPSAGVAYQYQSVDGYSEHGAGAGNVDVGDQDSDAIRVNAQLNVARTIAYDEFSLIPHIRLGIAGQFNNGDDVAGGFSTGDSFTLAQQDGNRVMGLGGAGLDIAFLNGVTASIDYDGQFSKDGDQNAVIAGVKLEW